MSHLQNTAVGSTALAGHLQVDDPKLGSKQLLINKQWSCFTLEHSTVVRIGKSHYKLLLLVPCVRSTIPATGCCKLRNCKWALEPVPGQETCQRAKAFRYLAVFSLTTEMKWDRTGAPEAGVSCVRGVSHVPAPGTGKELSWPAGSWGQQKGCGLMPLCPCRSQEQPGHEVPMDERVVGASASLPAPASSGVSSGCAALSSAGTCSL